MTDTQPEAPQQEAASVDLKTMELAESVGLIGPASRTHDLHAAIQRFHDLICANATIKVAQMAAEAISEAAPQADSVLEDAARWQELREQHESDEALCCVFAPNDMRECLVPVGSLPGELDAFMDSERASHGQAPAQQESFDRGPLMGCAAELPCTPDQLPPNHPTGALMPETSLTISQLPALAEPLEGGAFAGIVTMPDGRHAAVVLLPERGKDLDHPAAAAWAQELGGQLPTHPIAAMLFANCKPLLQPRWHWCLETVGASYAWSCDFNNGYQLDDHKSFEGSAVAVRLIPLAVASA